jgi:hypothetical protein
MGFGTIGDFLLDVTDFLQQPHFHPKMDDVEMAKRIAAIFSWSSPGFIRPQKNHVAHRADPIFHAGDAHFFGDPMIRFAFHLQFFLGE